MAKVTTTTATTVTPATQATTSRYERPSDDLVMARLLDHLDFLRLTHTERQLDALLAWARHEQPSPTELLEHVLGEEVEQKRGARIERRITQSGLPERKMLEVFDFDFQPTLDRGTVIELARLDFVERAEDVVINGNPGTGKSHILKAIGLRACERGIPFRYARCVDLVDDLHAGLADGTYPKRLRAWARPKLLVIDDVGLGHLKKHDDEPSAAHSLYNLIDRRHGRVSTAITSNIELSEWGRYLGDALITRAILDRIVMNAIRLRIEGPSYRQQVAEDRAKERADRRSKADADTKTKTNGKTNANASKAESKPSSKSKSSS
jgi:DNA replication protein DnaC